MPAAISMKADAQKCVPETILLGVGGLPRALPRFGDPAADDIRHYHALCQYDHGPNIPLHWYDGGNGWVTKYFYDSVPRDAVTYEPGKFRCQVPLPDGRLCEHEVSEGDCCKGNCCWSQSASAQKAMIEHVAAAHGVASPAPQRWSTGLFETEGCWDALLCAPCQGSRQMMAMAGWEDRMHWGWMTYFTCLSIAPQQGCNQIIYWVPPCLYVALTTRRQMVTLHNIDESFVASILKCVCCSICSVAQVHRELNSAGVRPGVTLCVGDALRSVAMKPSAMH
ncbi:Hypothetical protein, putative [Bodo saltans]|uniref:Uncharacterized protein n=1 Tax=Bodo saltans TaxID=75058 RepID=A0A0S4JRK4_BODSA|nr:Hypothetical protein, putative [Bodo saltans]|eukprot:CUG92832.1 Hypothetical protein, putative [Bodo saltans]